jgi:hypothetical protein
MPFCHRLIMSVFKVLIVNMTVLTCYGLVRMLMFIAFDEMEPEVEPHQ